jgi:pilus assembly protein CpaF
LPDGSRVHVIIPPLADRYPQVTVRKFLETIRNLDDLVRFQTLNEPMAEFLEACMQAKKNLLFSGATGSGKTTTLAAMSAYIDPQERIVSIEDTRELQLKQRHVVYLVTRSANIEGTGEVTLRDLLRNSLRMRPSRILLGEIRGAEALDYLQALSSGHRGCSAVLHASTPGDAVRRLETLALFAGLNLPVSAIRRQIAAGLDIVIQQEQLSDGARKITHISEVRGIKDDEVVIQDLFRYELEGTGDDGAVNGRFVAVAAPSDLSYFTRRGIRLPAALFE